MEFVSIEELVPKVHFLRKIVKVILSSPKELLENFVQFVFKDKNL